MSHCHIVKLDECFVLNENNNTLQLKAAWFPERMNDCYQRITVDHVLQYLTSMEADLALLNYFRALRVEGELVVNVPDADFYMQQWMDTEWTESAIKDADSSCRRSFAGLWGDQATGNPRNDNYSTHHSDVFKSAYNIKRLSFLLERAGFVDTQITNNHAGALSVKARKSLNKGERQVATDYSNIRQDHKNRYQFACDQLSLSTPKQLLDCACGIGYGSLMLSKATNAMVTGVDIDAGAIDYAQRYFCNENTKFTCQDARTLELSNNGYDAIISFETIEHVPFDQDLVNHFFRWLKPDGQLICSTPNQDVLPFDKERFSFHIKHYTNAELIELLRSAGFRDIQLYTQRDYLVGEVEPGDDGCFTIAVARKDL